MMLPLASMLLAVSIDPRIRLVELQVAGEPQRALEEAACLADSDPERARAIGVDFLRAHLLERLGRLREGTEAFAQAIGSSPSLAPWARLRLARVQEALGHPEVAAGIAATLLAQGAPRPLVAPAAALLFRTVRHGGDCRLLRGVPVSTLPESVARDFHIALAECHLRQQQLDAAKRELEQVLSGAESDLASLRAAELWLAYWPSPMDAARARTLGTVLAEQRDFAAAIPLLTAALAEIHDPGVPRDAATLYLLARAEFWSGRFSAAAGHFERLASTAHSTATRSDARHQQARSLELGGDASRALVLFEQAFAEDPTGEWSGPSLLAAFRLRWLSGDLAGADAILSRLSTERSWRSVYARAALFAAVSEIEKGDTSQRPHLHLIALERSGAASEEELSYWRGRLAELRGELRPAVEFYLRVLRERPYHPLAVAARNRLRRPDLAEAGRALARDKALSTGFEDSWAVWTLLGPSDAAGSEARERGLASLRADRTQLPWVDWQPVPVSSWPLWEGALTSPEEQFLALGIWQEGLPAQGRYFPTQRTPLSFTLALELERSGAVDRAIDLAERLFTTLPRRIPADWVAGDLQRLLYPLPYRARIEQGTARDPKRRALLAAILREESRFQPEAVSAVAARGLAQLVLPTARRLAFGLGWRGLRAEDLHRPEVSITLGATYLRELERRFGAGDEGLPRIVAAYNAGEEQAALWQRYCLTQEPEEYLAKVGFRETRAYLVRVLESRAAYASLYPD